MACALALAGCTTAITGTAIRGVGAATSATGVPSGSVTGPSGSLTESSEPITEPSIPVTRASGSVAGPSGTPTAPSGLDTTASTPDLPTTPAASTSTPEPFPSPDTTSQAPVTTWPVIRDTVAAHSIATVNKQGVITVRTPGSGDRVVLDDYEEPICPPCGEFDADYGPEIRQAIEDGTLAVRYRVATFLDDRSASGNYSTRAYAAMLALATTAGKQPGLFAAFHTMLFDAAVQPAEDGTTDLSDDQLAELARQAGAPSAAVRAIAKGTQMSLARAGATRTMDDIERLIPSHGVPAILVAGQQVSTADPDWLATVLQHG